MSDDRSRPSWWLALRTFDEPRQVFEDLARRPRWGVPLLLIVLASAVGAFGPPRAALEDAARQRAAAFQARSPERFTDENARAMVEGAATPKARLLIFGLGTVFAVVSLTVVSLILLWVFGATAASPLRFADEFAIVMHSYLPQLAGILLTVGLMRAGVPGFEVPDPSNWSLSFLFDDTPQTFRYVLASRFTLFGAWNVFLLALGNQVKTGSRSLTSPLLVVAGLWTLFNLGVATVVNAFTP